MSKLVELNVEGKVEYVSELKYDYILNIMKQAKKCKYIDKIMLFGSSLEERCNSSSDIDIAVFLNKSRGYVATTKSYTDFLDGVYYNKMGSHYDILCFRDDTECEDEIMKDIKSGVKIYERH